jgi:hypothetical protein
MLKKKDKDNKILMQLIKNHTKTVEATKKKVSRYVQILNLFVTMIPQLLIKLYKFMIRFDS